VLVDHPPQIPALAWRLRKRCSLAALNLPLRNPHFYPRPFIEKLQEHLLGRPLGFLGGQTYGLEPWAAIEWTPSIDVYSDDPKGRYFKLESGRFCSTFRGIIKLGDPERVIFRGWCKSH
jgi:hypothetical protein